MQLERVGRSSLISVPLTRQVLIGFRTRALRKRVWYRTLSRIERGLVDLTIQWVDHIQSKPMTRTVRKILRKLEEALLERVLRALRRGGLLALRISELAMTWGNKSALSWRFELDFKWSLGLGVVLN